MKLKGTRVRKVAASKTNKGKIAPSGRCLFCSRLFLFTLVCLATFGLVKIFTRFRYKSLSDNEIDKDIKPLDEVLIDALNHISARIDKQVEPRVHTEGREGSVKNLPKTDIVISSESHSVSNGSPNAITSVGSSGAQISSITTHQMTGIGGDISASKQSEPKVQSFQSGGLSWDEFAKLPFLKRSKIGPNLKASPISTATQSMVRCSAEVDRQLSSPVLSKDDFSWCQWALSSSGGQVRVGKSWGKLDKDKRSKERFDDLNCNAVSLGKNPSCDDEWGDAHIVNWAKSRARDVHCSTGRTSQVFCYDNNNKDRFCVMERVMIDFRKYTDVNRGPDRTKSRKFSKGFIAADCDSTDGKYFPFDHLYSPSLQSRTCDKIVNGTVLMFSHDDFSNIGHTMNDFQNVWVMMWLDNRGRYFNETPFLNIDALKLGHSYQDKIGKFHTFYQRDFPGFLRGDEFKGSSVCFQRLLVQPVPPKFFVWGSWFTDSTCSFRGPSSLHQRWNLHLRHSFGLLPDSLNLRAASIRGQIRIIFIVRNVHKNLWGSNRSSRNILNMKEITAKLDAETANWNKLHAEEGVHIEMVYQDLAQLTIVQQIELAASSSIIMGTHGAGIVLSNLMPIGKENCCGVFEIYPQGEFTPIRGHGNMARKTGLHYDRLDVDSEHSRANGVEPSPSQVWEKLIALVDAMRKKPSCVLSSVIDDPYLEMNRG